LSLPIGWELSGSVNFDIHVVVGNRRSAWREIVGGQIGTSTARGEGYFTLAME
jgi:hypothetical protein